MALSDASAISAKVTAKTPTMSEIPSLPAGDRGVAAVGFKAGTYRGFRTATLGGHPDTIGSVEEYPNV